MTTRRANLFTFPSMKCELADTLTMDRETPLVQCPSTAWLDEPMPVHTLAYLPQADIASMLKVRASRPSRTETGRNSGMFPAGTGGSHENLQTGVALQLHRERSAWRGLELARAACLAHTALGRQARRQGAYSDDRMPYRA